MMVEGDHRIAVGLLEDINRIGYIHEMAASKKRSIHRRLNKIFLTVKESPHDGV